MEKKNKAILKSLAVPAGFLLTAMPCTVLANGTEVIPGQEVTVEVNAAASDTSVVLEEAQAVTVNASEQTQNADAAESVVVQQEQETVFVQTVEDVTEDSLNTEDAADTSGVTENIENLSDQTNTGNAKTSDVQQDAASSLSGTYVTSILGMQAVIQVADDGSFSVETNRASWSTGEDYPNGTVTTSHATGMVVGLSDVDEYTKTAAVQIGQDSYAGLDQDILGGYKYVYDHTFTPGSYAALNIVLPGAPDEAYPAAVISYDTTGQRSSTVTMYTTLQNMTLVFFRKDLEEYVSTYEKIQQLKTPASEVPEDISELSGTYVVPTVGASIVMEMEDDGSFWVETKLPVPGAGEEYPNGTIITGHATGTVSNLNSTGEYTKTADIVIGQDSYAGLIQDILGGYKYFYDHSFNESSAAVLNIVMPGAPDEVYPEDIVDADTIGERKTSITFYTVIDDNYLVFFRKDLPEYESVYDKIQELKAETPEEPEDLSDLSGTYVTPSVGVSVVMDMDDDGNFWVETNMPTGVTGEDYPNGTIITSYTTGTVSNLTSTSDYTQTADILIGEDCYAGCDQDILGGIKYEYVHLYEPATTAVLNIVLPGAPDEYYPKEFLDWDYTNQRETSVVCYAVINGQTQVFVKKDLPGYESTYDKIRQLKAELPQGPVEVEFSYAFAGQDFTETCIYSDEYFQKDAHVYDPSLATTSLALAMSTFNSAEDTDYSSANKNVVSLLSEMGFTGIVSNPDYYTAPGTDTIGVTFANKTLNVDGEPTDLVVIAVRGGGYGSEWASNFTMGDSDQHEGFSAAKVKILEQLKAYLENSELTDNIMFWVTGYSRGAAVANLVSGSLTENVTLTGTVLGTKYQSCTCDIYSYCFETPRGQLDGYTDLGAVGFDDSNIFNILNPNDLVTYVAPSAAGFTHYGNDLYLPSQATNPYIYNTLKEKMLEFYYQISGIEEGSYNVDDFTFRSILELLPDEILAQTPGLTSMAAAVSQEYFILNLINDLWNEDIVSRENYVNTYQAELRNILGLFLGYNGLSGQPILNELTQVVVDGEGWTDMVYDILAPISYMDEETATATVTTWLVKALAACQIPVSNSAVIQNAVKNLCSLVYNLAKTHPSYIATILENGSSLKTAHYPQLTLAWLRTADTNYSDVLDAQFAYDNMFTNGSFRLIRINCDVNVDVYDSKGDLVGSISGYQVADGSIISLGIDEAGSRYICLPTDGGFMIQVTPLTDTTVDVSVDEFERQLGQFTRCLDYLNIQMGTQNVLRILAPSYANEEIDAVLPEGSSANYQVLIDATTLPATSELSGDSAKAAVRMSLDVNDEQSGYILGDGDAYFGEYKILAAVPYDGYRFSHWLINGFGGFEGSDSNVLRLCLTNDASIMAIFEEIEDPATPEDPETPDTPEDPETPDTPETPTEEQTKKPTTAVNTSVIKTKPSDSGSVSTAANTNQSGFLLLAAAALGGLCSVFRRKYWR